MNEDTLRTEITSALDTDGQLTCEAAHEIAERLEVRPLDVAKQANHLRVRITRCQLGFFGYAPAKGMPGYKLVRQLDTLPEPASTVVQEAAAQGKISCLKLWRIAEQERITRPEMGDIVETLKIKVTPCQLGCF